MGSDGSPAQCVVEVSAAYKTADKAGPFSLPWLENAGIWCGQGREINSCKMGRNRTLLDLLGWNWSK